MIYIYIYTYLHLLFSTLCDAVVLVKALGSAWAEVSEEIGLWIPVELINKEHDDKPEGAEDLGTKFTIHFLSCQWFSVAV